MNIDIEAERKSEEGVSPKLSFVHSSKNLLSFSHVLQL